VGCRELEARFGLRRLGAGQRGTGSRGSGWPPPANRRRDHGSWGEHPERGSRHTLERVVRACATASRAERELVRALREQGVGVRRGWSEEDGERERAVGEWSSSDGAQRSVLARRAELEQRGLLWHRCTMEIERVRQGLRAASSDPVACVHAAREGAGMLAAWSIDLEGERPGALARPSRQLALGLLAGDIGRVHAPAASSSERTRSRVICSVTLEQIRARIDTDRRSAVLDAETEAARRARDPLGPATRATGEGPDKVDDVEAVRRLIDPTCRPRPRQR
jgi:hypothetical protein